LIDRRRTTVGFKTAHGTPVEPAWAGNRTGGAGRTTPRPPHFYLKLIERRFVVRKPRCAIGVSILLAVFVAGCGGGSEVETVPFKQTDTSQFKGMIDQQAKGLKGGTKTPATSPK
jgi:hypothetical protein